MKTEKLLAHLQRADMHMRELFGYYWHRRNAGIPKETRNALVWDIKNGEKLIKSLKK